MLAQARPGPEEARRQALSVSYGRVPLSGTVFGHEARLYELGPEVPADDIDGREPAVVTWHDGDMFYLLASTTLNRDALQRIGMSLYRSKSPPTDS